MCVALLFLARSFLLFSVCVYLLQWLQKEESWLERERASAFWREEACGVEERMSLLQISSGTVDSVAVVGWSGDLFFPWL